MLLMGPITNTKKMITPSARPNPVQFTTFLGDDEEDDGKSNSIARANFDASMKTEKSKKVQDTYQY